MKKLAIGVDIGGINTAFGLVDENGDLYAESVISTKKYPYVDDYPAYKIWCNWCGQRSFTG